MRLGLTWLGLTWLSKGLRQRNMPIEWVIERRKLIVETVWKIQALQILEIMRISGPGRFAGASGNTRISECRLLSENDGRLEATRVEVAFL
jgi:hypothetical protein